MITTMRGEVMLAVVVRFLKHLILFVGLGDVLTVQRLERKCRNIGIGNMLGVVVMTMTTLLLSNCYCKKLLMMKYNTNSIGSKQWMMLMPVPSKAYSLQ